MLVECSSCSRSNRLPAPRLRDKAKCAACKAPLLPLVRPLVVRSAQDFDELVRGAPTPLLVDFWAGWCGPCRAVAPELDKIAKEHNEQVTVVKVDTEALPDLAARFSIRSIPTMVLLRAGKETQRLSGAMSAREILTRLSL